MKTKLIFTALTLIVIAGCASPSVKSLNRTANPHKITTVTLGWGSTPNATGYILQGGPVGGSVSLLARTASTSHQFTGLNVGTTYAFSVVATNAAGSSTPSTTVTWLAAHW